MPLAGSAEQALVDFSEGFDLPEDPFNKLNHLGFTEEANCCQVAQPEYGLMDLLLSQSIHDQHAETIADELRLNCGKTKDKLGILPFARVGSAPAIVGATIAHNNLNAVV